MLEPTAKNMVASPSQEWQAGEVVLDLYEVKGLLGEGGMGKVYRVHHTGWNLDLAVKSPRPDILAKEGGRENFTREAETWVNLGLHPHIVSCYYVRTIEDIPRVFAEYVEGGSLSDWIYTRRLYVGEVQRVLGIILDVAIQCAWGLHHAHEQGLVHQDMKPGNVMMSPDGAAKVTDFGLARAREAAGEVSQGIGEPRRTLIVPGAGLMTPAYASPEQVKAQSLTRRTDMWSWGASVLEMFAGKIFWFFGEYVNESLEQYLEDWSEADGIPRMPDDLIELLRRCFSAEPSHRPASMKEVADNLQLIYSRVMSHDYPRLEPQGGKGTADSFNNRALSLLDIGKEKEAEEAWQTALAADLKHSETTYNLGVLRWRRGEMSDIKLIQQLESVRALHESQWMDDYLLALVHIERGDLESATSLLEKAAQQAPASAEVRKALHLVRSGSIAPNIPRKVLTTQSESCVASFVKPDGREVLMVGTEGIIERLEVETGRRLSNFGSTGLVSPDDEHRLPG